MNLKTSKLRDAIAFALAASATALAGTGVAFAQQQTDEERATTLDRIQVTGTRIRQVDVETAQPVTFITREDIEKQGFQSVADILQNISATGTPPLTRASPLSAGENAGGTFISLRNLGAQRTLVLLNGKRLGISTSGLADISTIPAAAVERIEVLKDGASSIYGSDAIAGVINIITRSNFEGATASAYYGQYGQGDGAITKGDMVFGFTGDRGSLTMATEWREEDAVFARNRPFSAFPRSDIHPFDNWTPVGQFGGFVTTATTPVPGLPSGTRVVLREGGNSRLITDYIRQDLNTGSCAPATATNPGPQPCTPGSPLHKSNTNLQTDLRTPLESRSFYVDGIWDIADAIRFRTNLLYSNRTTDRTVAGYPYQAAAFGTPMSAQSYYNPTGATITNWWRRTWEVPRVSSADSTVYRFTGGFEGSFDWIDRVFDWDVSYLHNNNRQVQSTYGNLNVARTQASVGPSFFNPTLGRVQCGTPTNPIPLSSCVPWNPFLPFGVEGNDSLTNNRALQDFLFQEEHATGETKTQVITANIASTILALPAGDLAFAFGLENRKETGQFVPDALAVTGASTNLSSGPTRGGYSVNEAYLELQIPILADMPGFRELTLDVATRYSDYDTFGNTTNNKFGLKWKPFDSLLLRATHADGFRAPTIADLFGGGSQTFSFFSDPCDTVRGLAATNATVRANCQNGVGGNGALGALAPNYRQLGQGFVPVGTQPSQTPVAFTSGSNPLLTPELSKGQTIGAVWSVPWIEGLNFSVDWWKIRIGDTIVADSPTAILNDCYVQGIASRCSPQLFTRDPVLGIPTVTFGGRNAGFRKVEGFDVDWSYRWNTADWGTFSVNQNTTYTAKDYFVSTNDPRVALSSVGFTSTFRIRSNLNIGWQMGNFGMSWIARYYSSMKEGCTYFTPSAAGVPPVTEPHLECNGITFAPTGAFNPDGTPASSLSRRNRTGSNTFNDVQFRWEAPWNATIAVGANNVFERYGPVMYSQPSANVSYYGGFDIGRFLYMKYTQRF
jgi:iron complex outermembrane recepter protein